MLRPSISVKPLVRAVRSLEWLFLLASLLFELDLFVVAIRFVVLPETAHFLHSPYYGPGMVIQGVLRRCVNKAFVALESDSGASRHRRYICASCNPGRLQGELVGAILRKLSLAQRHCTSPSPEPNHRTIQSPQPELSRFSLEFESRVYLKVFRGNRRFFVGELERCNCFGS